MSGEVAGASTSVPGVGARVMVDFDYPGKVAYKGKIKGRKGDWLGLSMEETVGDCDGAVGDERYFECHDGQGLFIKWESGRVVSAPEKAVIPEAVLKHMEMLFEMCDESQTGGLDVNELQDAMKLLGQPVKKKDAQAIFKKVMNDGDRVATRVNAIEFDEFRVVMENQWVGVDLDAVVNVIRIDEEQEKLREAEAKEAALGALLVVDVMGFTVDLKYFGAGTNLGLLVVYGSLALAVTGHLLLAIPDDMTNRLLIAVLGGSAALFAIGGVAIKNHDWPLVKLYAVLLFFAAGAQVALLILFKTGLFQMSTSVVASIMDRECGTCIGNGRCATVSSSILPPVETDADLTNQPWYCCCAHNKCRGSELVVQSQANCEDGCTVADLTGTNSESRLNCMAQAESFNLPTGNQACTYLSATDARCDRGVSCPQNDPTHPLLIDQCYIDAGVAVGGELSVCPDMSAYDSSTPQATMRLACTGSPGCQYTYATRRACTQADDAVHCYSYVASNSSCTSAGTCVYTAIEYGGTIGLSDGKEAAKQACQARDDYQNYARLHSYPMLSVLGEQQCFDGVDEPNDLSGYGGLVGCLAAYQSGIQEAYMIFQMVMLPIVLVAAYVGWVLPDVYLEAKSKSESVGVDNFLDNLEFSNPIDEESGGGGGDGANLGHAVGAQEKARQSYHDRQRNKEDAIADALRQAKQEKKQKDDEKDLRTRGPFLSGQRKPTNADIAKAQRGARASPSRVVNSAGSGDGAVAEQSDFKEVKFVNPLDD